MTLDGLFAEPFEIHGTAGWPARHGKRDLLFSIDREINIENYRSNNLEELKSQRLSLGYDIEEWRDLVPENSQSLQNLYTGMANSLDVDVLGFRWNQNLSYAPIWLDRSDNNYWLVSIRNPLDRTVSNMKTHSWEFQDCYDITMKYSQNLTKLKELYEDRVIFVKYEDTIRDPKKSVQQIMKKLDHQVDEINTHNLIGADGKEYRSQGWRVKSKRGDHRIGSKFEGMYTKSVGQYSKHLTKHQINLFKESLKESQIFGDYFIGE